MRLSLSQLTELARRYGFADPAFAAAVATAESGGETTAVHDSTGQASLSPGTMPERSIGLWQINTINSGGDGQPNGYAGLDLTDPGVNAQAAYAISSGGTRWVPGWTWTIRHGSYRPYYAGSSFVDSNGTLRRGLVVPLRTNAVPVLFTAVVAATLAAAAGYAALERRRFA